MEYITKRIENRIYLGDDPHNPIGELDYYINREGIIVATHTGVRNEYRGQGLANILFLDLIELAKEKNTKIIPICSYVVAQLKRNEFSAFLHKN